MKYRRLKTTESTSTPILRYYELADGEEALTNCFYEIKDNKASKITGEPTGQLIGFSHGGDRLAEGLIFLDINTFVVYMGLLEDEDDDRPDIGDVVNGYQKVIDTHYDGDEGVHGKGTNPKEWGVEDIDNPYYLFVIEQVADGTEATIDDEDAGEEVGPSHGGKVAIKVANVTPSAASTMTLTYTPKGGTQETETLAGEGGSHTFKIDRGGTLGDKYSEITVIYADESEHSVDLTTVYIADTVLEYTQHVSP